MAGYSKCDRCKKPIGEILYRINGEYDRIRTTRNIYLHSEFSIDLCERCFREMETQIKKEDASKE